MDQKNNGKPALPVPQPNETSSTTFVPYSERPARSVPPPSGSRTSFDDSFHPHGRPWSHGSDDF